MEQHSPLPWRAYKHWIFNPDNDYLLNDDRQTQYQYDAEFICTSVNNHERLVAFVRKVAFQGMKDIHKTMLSYRLEAEELLASIENHTAGGRG